ncbi:thiamine phosphate synthase [Methylobacterium nodulans]|uniref:Thiamine-phosphate synthase n=1 Tax=Methylobacterium nodulans (strain LMG 21967 / CNCM I-2342 / ORS 2060) TaxID=460265 RepID=B8IPG0_METNO|nr:thiamine phosphate synthase [Methylobacterium nodulans]ACL62252.1 thiamine monophosphate synthase [Methylobacterium nodulans ORS 2060]
MNGLPARLLLVTDRHGSDLPLLRRVGAALEAGARWIWLRDRDLPEAERAALAADLARLVRGAGGRLTIGRDVDLAARIGADGVQLASAAVVAEARARLGPGALIGLSAHRLAEIAAAREAGADYATLSPIFASASKPGYGPALGPAALAQAARTGLPVIALGGVEPGTAPACLAAGAAGVAVMGGVMRAADPGAAVQALLKAMAREPRDPLFRVGEGYGDRRSHVRVPDPSE